MSQEGKKGFWDLIYKKVTAAINNRYPFSVIFTSDESDEGYSVIIQEKDYLVFLNNFLKFSENLERYETCIEIKALIEKLKEWHTEINTD